MTPSTEHIACIRCSNTYPISEVRYHCDCGGLLTIERTRGIPKTINPQFFDKRLASRDKLDRSGVWRFREAILNLPPSSIVTHPEGGTNLYHRSSISSWAGLDKLLFKHEGENPTGSFKDRGMTVAVSQAKHLRKKIVACASTGNTSASLAAYAAHAGMKAIVFIPSGKIALGKLAQAIGYGAQCIAIHGNFDDAMTIVQQLAEKSDIYLVNSLNPFRLEGQKSIIWEMLQDMQWQVPDWIVVPGGNLGNTSAFGKALREAKQAGWIDRLPRIATIQAEGANPFYQSYVSGFQHRTTVKAETIATAIQIGNPVNIEKAIEVIQSTSGLVYQVSDTEILEAKGIIDRAGIGCEPASAATLAGVKNLVASKTIKPDDSVCCILTGHILKDPDAILKSNRSNDLGSLLTEVEADLAAIEKLLQ